MVDKIKAHIVELVENETDLVALDRIWKFVIHIHDRETGIETAIEEKDIAKWQMEVEASKQPTTAVTPATPSNINLPFQPKGTGDPFKSFFTGKKGDSTAWQRKPKTNRKK